jgi:dihydrofolate reductase
MSIHETFQGPADLMNMMRDPKIVIVVALGKNRELGRDEKLLWHIPDDLKRFKALTLGHPVIMGRKTFESIVQQLGKPLPGRTNIVVTRDPGYTRGLEEKGYTEVQVAHSLDEAISMAKMQNPKEIHIGGGAQLYTQALPIVDRLRLTLIDDTTEADTFFPEYQGQFPIETFREEHDHNGLKYTWVDLER